MRIGSLALLGLVVVALALFHILSSPGDTAIAGPAASSLPAPTAALGPAQNVQYVRVQLRGRESLNLAEVQVFGGSTNLARGQTATATQSSELGAFGDCTGANTATADKAVDGNISGAFADCSVSHTNVEDQPYWQVNLGSLQTVDRIVLFNRTDDCCSARLSDFDRSRFRKRQ